MAKYAEFTAYRQKLNKKILEQGNLEIKRFFALDNQVYQPGALPAKTKELLGLAASMVLRCDDCVSYHVMPGPAGPKFLKRSVSLCLSAARS